MRRASSSSPVQPGPLLFGVATSDHQCEAFDPRYRDIWDLWEETVGLTPRGRATDFWNRYREDIELARELGCRAFRISIAWARVEPAAGEYSEQALAHYRDVLEAIRAAGMAPIVTLHHWTWPLHVEARGGMAGPEFSGIFRGYAAEVARRLGEGVPYWLTFNEPNALPFGYIRLPWQRHYPMPPGMGDATTREQVDAVAQLIRNLFLAHTAAREEIRALYPEAKFGCNPCILGMPEWFQRWADRRLTRSRSQTEWARREERAAVRVEFRRVKPGRRAASLQSLIRAIPEALEKLRSFTTLWNTNWWHLGMAGKLPRFLCPPECVGQQDFVGLDYYWGTDTLRCGRVFQLIEAMAQKFDRAPIWPRGLHNALCRYAQLFPGMEILIAENGCPDRQDMDRSTYLRRHLREVMRARQRGINVVGYLCWSLTTSREWGLPPGAASDFGLYHIDLDGESLERVPTPSARVYQNIVEMGSGRLLTRKDTD